jgi:hypothetical protein
MRHPYATTRNPTPDASAIGPVLERRTRPVRAVTARHPRWYRGAIVRGGRKGFCVAPRRGVHRTQRAAVLAAGAACALLAAGCGGGSYQTAREPKGTFPMQVVHASFPATQTIARQTKLVLLVRNTGTRTVPNVAVTLNAFDYTSDYPGLAARKRPVWVIERGPGAIASRPVESEEISIPGGGQTAYVNTWALGALAPGQTRKFAWDVVPVKSGSHTVSYTVAAGLAGNAKARTANGEAVQGQFAIDIAPAPKLTHVNPNTGKVEVGQFPSSP